MSDAYDKLAAEYYEPFHKTCRNLDAATAAALRHHAVSIPPTGCILEVGCGRGRSQEFLGVDATRIVQLDSSRQMLALTERENCVLRVLADATSIPLFDQQFSAVTGFLVDAFIGLDFFSEAFRLLSPTGTLVFTTPAAEWALSLRQSSQSDVDSARFITKNKNVVIVPSTVLKREKIAEMLSYCGFKSIAIHQEPLPKEVNDISPDVEKAAWTMRTTSFEFPLVYLVVARKA